MPTHISPDDVLPALRHSVIFGPNPQGLGEGLVTVVNMTSGEEVELRGFETSLARMLDGHRTAREVVVASQQLGLPLTMLALEGFVNELQSHALLDADGAELAEPSPWNPRQEWDEQTRRQFRKALREGRSGHVMESAGALDGLLERVPQVPEVRALRQRVQAEPGAVAGFPRVFEQAQRRWLAFAQADEAGAVKPAWLSTRGVLAGTWALAIFAVGVIAAAVLPIPRTVVASILPVPSPSAKVSAPRTGTVALVAAAVGQRVNKGDVLFSYDVAPTLSALELALQRLEAQRGQPPAPATEGVAFAEAEVERAERVLGQARLAAGDPFSEQVLSAERDFNEALDRLQGAQLELEASQPAQRRAAVERLEAQVRQLEQERIDSDVRAPEAGVVAALAVHPGEVVFRGQDAVQLDQPERPKATAVIEDPSGLERGQQGRVIAAGGQVVQATVTKVEGLRVELELDGALPPGPAQVELRARPRPLLR